MASRGASLHYEPHWAQLMVTHIENSCTFWAQDFVNRSMIQGVVQQVNYYGFNASRLESRPEKENVYVAKYKMDGEWYRCKVKSYTPTGATVFYLDFGNTGVVGFHEIADLPSELQKVPPLCQKYRLEGVKPVMGALQEDRQNAGRKWLLSLTTNEIVTAHTYRMRNVPGWIADCWVNDVNLSSRVLSLGFALSTYSMGIMRNGVESPMARKAPVEKFPVAAAKEDVSVVAKGKEARRMGNRSSAKSPVAAKSEKWVMQKKINVLEREVNGLKAAKLTPMVKKLIPLIRRGIRLHELYTSCGEKPVDNLLEGLTLLDAKIEETGDLTKELKDVEEKEAKLKKVQKEIKDCKKKSELKGKVVVRNKLRKEFYEAVQAYLEKGRHVKERHDRLKGVHDAILKNYSHILAKGAADIPAKDIDATVESYKKWKEEREEALTELHKNVRSLRSTAGAKLTEVAAAIEDDGCDLKELPDVDGVLVELRDAAKKEAKCMHPDKEAVGGLARAVKTALLREIDAITTLVNAHVKYTFQAKDMEKWLNTSPDVDSLRGYERELEAVRSRIRRKLVDEKEESKKSEEGHAIKGIKKELDSLRIQSQDLENKMSELKGIMKEHFPELCLLHPELNLTSTSGQGKESAEKVRKK